MDFRIIAKLARFKEIVMTLLKYGFDDLVQRLDLPGTALVKKFHKTEKDLGTYERFRRVLEDLGPTFVKLGQIMSLRPDLLPPPLIQELTKLQDDVPPEDFEQIRTVIDENFDGTLEEVFSIFDPEPLAAASVSQVHRGVLRKEGRIVSIKVQRPGIQKKLETDLDILEAIADRLQNQWEDLSTYDLPNLIRVTRRNLLREIDFKREARNMKIARKLASDGSLIYVPEVYEDYCSEKVLVMEYIQGAKLDDTTIRDLDDPLYLAKNGLNAAIKQILEDGFFHADPHPGNLLISDEKGLCLMDWGMVGRLTERDRYELVDLLEAIVEKDSDAMLKALLRISKGKKSIDERGLERELLDILDSFYAVPIKDLNIGQLLLAITELLREYDLRLPPDLVIMVKALITAEGTARRIYPDLDVISEAESRIRHLATKRFHPETMWRRFRRTMSNLLSLQHDFPSRLLKIFEKMEHGQLNLHFQHENLGVLMNALENSSNRLTFGIITAALIIGSSMIITTGVGPLLFGFPALGVVGYMISGLLGLWLVFSIIRTKRY